MKRLKVKFNKYWYAGITAFVVLAAALVVQLLFDNLGVLGDVLAAVNSALFPVYIGIIIAYLLSPLVDKSDEFIFIPLFRKIMKKENRAKGTARGCSVVLVLILALLVIFGLIMLVVPEVLDSITSLVSDLPGYFSNMKEWGTKVLHDHPTAEQYFMDFTEGLYGNLSNWLKNDLLPNSNRLLTMVSDSLVNAFNVLFNMFIGLIISIYLMASKENFCAQAKKLMYAIFPVKKVNGMLSVLRETHMVFAKFISGKIIDSLAVGILTFIIMSIVGIPYTVLISVIIGVTNIIPFFGQYIGIIPSTFLVLIVDPVKGLIFLVLIIIIMQFDGNVMGPKILGDSIGLKSFWILFSILFFGSLFGLLGMVCAVPLFAMLYRMVKRWSAKRLAGKEMPTETDYYLEWNEPEEEEEDNKSL